jgi:hypothetical protein
MLVNILVKFGRCISLFASFLCACVLSSFLDRIPAPPARRTQPVRLLHQARRSLPLAQPSFLQSICSCAVRAAQTSASCFNCDVVAGDRHPILAFTLATHASDSSPPLNRRYRSCIHLSLDISEPLPGRLHKAGRVTLCSRDASLYSSSRRARMHVVPGVCTS